MTRLDRAFIKVYSKTSGTPNGPHAVHGVTSPAGEAAFSPDAEHCRLDLQHAEQPPHWAPQPEVATYSTWDLAAAAEPLAAVAPAPQHAESGQSELSGDAHGSGSAESASSSASDSSALHAAFEVDNLLWPEINYSLSAACRPQWNQLIKEIMQASGEGQKIVLVTSHRRGEGRTSLVLCLAQLLSQKQQRVAIVDADLQRPQIARQLKLLPACSWDDVVRDAQPLTEAWIESVRDGVTLLPISDRGETKGLAGNPRLKEMLQALRQQNDVVLIDAGSLSDANDREMLALLGGTAQIDSAIIVRDERVTTWDTLHDSQRCLDAIGIGRWDVVENFAD